MELHHGRHHKAYVENANETLEKLAEARGKEDFSRLAALEKALAFNLSGHVLHSIFWNNLAPRAGGEPAGELARLIDRDFGFFDAVWHLWNWDDVAARLEAARKLDLEVPAAVASTPARGRSGLR